MKIKLTEEQLKSLLGEAKKKKKKKKKSTTLCARGKNAAKAKYDVYPSAYANGYAVQVCKGKIAGLDGSKRCSGKYCSGKKNESVTYTKEQIIENVKKKSQETLNLEDVEVVDRLDEDLATWFGTKKKKKGSKQPQGPWVNICRKKKGGGHPACGRDDSDKGGYPVCRAKSVASNMSQSAKDSACRRKRDKEKNDGKSGKGQSPSPIKVKGYKPKKRKSKKNESLNINRMVLSNYDIMISEGLQYHLDNQIPLNENVYRYGSEEYFNLINEVRSLHKESNIDLSIMDEELVKQSIGDKGVYEGKDVWLNFPMEEVRLYEAKHNGREVSLNSPKKTGSQNYVYVTGCLKDKSKVKKITYGSAMKDKLKDPDRRKAFAARHGCEGLSLKDKCTKKYWACRKPKDFAGVNSWW
jgi:regulator of replication initiation timing